MDIVTLIIDEEHSGVLHVYERERYNPHPSYLTQHHQYCAINICEDTYEQARYILDKIHTISSSSSSSIKSEKIIVSPNKTQKLIIIVRKMGVNCYIAQRVCPAHTA